MKRKRWKIAGLILAAVVAVVVIASVWYVNDYYHSDESVAAYLESSEQVTVTEISDGLFFDGPGTEQALIFYPGAKVEYSAYAPLMSMLAANGLDCFLVKMPCNLAVLDVGKADDILSHYNYDTWYLGGHSLGGAMAATYASKHLNDIKGLVLLAAYPTKSLIQDGFSVLSIYGSEDGVLNREKLESSEGYMPKDYTQVVIQGGNHAWFGDYGEQDGDGTASISHEEQWRQTAESILNWLKK